MLRFLRCACFGRRSPGTPLLLFPYRTSFSGSETKVFRKRACADSRHVCPESTAPESRHRALFVSSCLVVGCNGALSSCRPVFGRLTSSSLWLLSSSRVRLVMDDLQAAALSRLAGGSGGLYSTTHVTCGGQALWRILFAGSCWNAGQRSSCLARGGGTANSLPLLLPVVPFPTPPHPFFPVRSSHLSPIIWSYWGAFTTSGFTSKSKGTLLQEVVVGAFALPAMRVGTLLFLFFSPLVL